LALNRDFNDVLVFLEVARLRSFTAAGESLDLPASAVSRRVRRLEDRLGFRLLHRTTRRVGLTEAGRIYYERVGAFPRMMAEAERALSDSRQAPAGTLRITAPPEDRGVIWGILGPFIRDHPLVDLEIRHTLDYVDLIDEDVDVALRGGAPPDSPDLVARQLWDSRILLAASPEYLALHGTPGCVEDLADHKGVCMDPWAPNAIRRLDGDRQPVKISMRNRIRANSLETARRAALDGLGIAPLLELTCQEDLDRGALVEVLRGALPDSAAGWYVYPVGRTRSAAAQALLDYLARLAKENLAHRNP
jgi:DNA-binding transcriptional LysR family regulator